MFGKELTNHNRPLARKGETVMKLKDFENLTPGAEVIIKGRRAKLEGNPQIGSGHYYPNSKDYGWATFRYVDTRRKVIKRNRQVELASSKE